MSRSYNELLMHEGVLDTRERTLTPNQIKELKLKVDPQARFAGRIIVDSEAIIEAALIGERTVFGMWSYIGKNACTGYGVALFRSASIEKDSTVLDGGSVGYMAKVDQGSVIGRDVHIPEQTYVGPDNIIADKSCLTVIGPLGEQGDNVLIYASVDGPLYSFGDRREMGWREARRRITANDPKDFLSHSDYQTRYKELLHEGNFLQRHFDELHEAGEINELLLQVSDLRHQFFV